MVGPRPCFSYYLSSVAFPYLSPSERVGDYAPEGDQPADVVHRARLLDRRGLHRQRQRHRRVDRPDSLELAQPARTRTSLRDTKLVSGKPACWRGPAGVAAIYSSAKTVTTTWRAPRGRAGGDTVALPSREGHGHMPQAREGVRTKRTTLRLCSSAVGKRTPGAARPIRSSGPRGGDRQRLPVSFERGLECDGLRRYSLCSALSWLQQTPGQPRTRR